MWISLVPMDNKKGGPRGTRHKKLQNSDPIKLEGRFAGIKVAYITGVH
jgi:hypothetical protein